MRKKVFILSSVLLCAVLAFVFVLPVFAASNSWWNSPVDVKVTAKLNLYKNSYWATMLRPSYLRCDSASLTVGNQIFIGTIKAHWWTFRSCEVTFQDVPANENGTLRLSYLANGNRSVQKSVYVGKTWWDAWRLPNLTLPWWED